LELFFFDYVCSMKLNYLFFALIIVVLSACNAVPAEQATATEEPDECKQEDLLTPTLVDGFYGQSFDTSAALLLNASILNFKNGANMDSKIKGTISTVCQSKGCWFSLKGQDTTITVDFAHKFLMHKDLAGNQVIANGKFYYDTTSVEQQIHELVDDAKTMTLEEAKKKIKSPIITLGFEATGIKILK